MFGSNSGLLYPQCRVEKGGILYCRCCIGVSISDGRRRVFGSQVLTTLLFNTSVNSCGMTCDCRCVTVAAIYHSYILLLLSIIIHLALLLMRARSDPRCPVSDAFLAKIRMVHKLPSSWTPCVRNLFARFWADHFSISYDIYCAGFSIIWVKTLI